MDPIILDLLPHITKFLEDPSESSGFLVPTAYAGPKLAELKAAGIATKTVACAASSHAFEAVRIAFTADDRSAQLDAALALIFGSNDRSKYETMLCFGGKGSFDALVVPKAASVEVHDKRDDLETEKEFKLRRIALAEYEKMLRTLARLSGLTVHFHAEGSGIRPPYKDVPGVVHIITNAQPPGQTSARYLGLAFGMKIHEEGLSVLANGPTKGRGTVVKDQLGEALVQILGNTWYLLMPTLSHFNWQTSGLIFDRLLALAWKGSREAAVAKASKPATRKGFVEATMKWTADLPVLIAADILNMDRKIEDAQRQIAEYTRSKKESLAMLETFSKSSFIKETHGRLPKDFAAIMHDPNVARLVVIDEGFHVETAPLEIVHDGKRYAMGSFTIRIAKRGSVSVWCEAPTHMDGIPHPHIAKEGGPCFGNATRAIAEAAGEQRYADAVRYVFRWLTEGYTHALAAVKIEEWPYVGETPDHYETRWHVAKALADADAAANAAGVRVRPVSAIAEAVNKIVVDLTKGAEAEEAESSESQAPSSALEARSSELEAPQKEASDATDA
ncbi:MAG TPA: hypothetical protein VL500_04305 [Candidatus Eisenbacteria bacterium]|nr:hypothetical protein [Candidatus Eisenbacteria bacterium]